MAANGQPVPGRSAQSMNRTGSGRELSRLRLITGSTLNRATTAKLGKFVRGLPLNSLSTPWETGVERHRAQFGLSVRRAQNPTARRIDNDPDGDLDLPGLSVVQADGAVDFRLRAFILAVMSGLTGGFAAEPDAMPPGHVAAISASR